MRPSAMPSRWRSRAVITIRTLAVTVVFGGPRTVAVAPGTRSNVFTAAYTCRSLRLIRDSLLAWTRRKCCNAETVFAGKFGVPPICAVPSDAT